MADTMDITPTFRWNVIFHLSQKPVTNESFCQKTVILLHGESVKTPLPVESLKK
jgi:hypothetical protein